MSKLSDEQKKYVIDNYCDMKTKDIAKKIGADEHSINGFANHIGLHKNFTNRLSLDEVDAKFIADNYSTMTYSEIGRHLNLTSKQVEGWVRNHIKDRITKRRVFDNHYFDNIDTPDKAYWLGFIYADGWISHSKARRASYELGIELQRQDRYILEEFNNCLGGVHKIYDFHREVRIAANKNATHTDTSAIRIYSKDIVCSLNKNGIDFNKTYTNTIPVVSDELFADFLRGYIDGDGCIHYMKYGVLGVHITSANKVGLEYIQNKIRELWNVDARIYSEDYNGVYKTKYRLYCFRQDCVKILLDNIYANVDSIKLKRKYDIYKTFYGLAA